MDIEVRSRLFLWFASVEDSVVPIIVSSRQTEVIDQ